jgi:hypothetical protein
MHTMKTFVIGLATALTLAAAGASAQTSGPAAPPTTCQQQLVDLQKTWSDVFPPAKPSAARVQGREGHAHSGIEYAYMSRQFRQATAACKAGEGHAAMLRMDVIRAILKLPEVAHPAARNYQPNKR